MAEQFKLKTTTEVKSLADELNKPESGAYLEQMRQLSESPEYQKATPPDTQSTLKDALAKAQELHGQNATRNEWLEVAQKLGDAVTRYGAARAGLASGVDMSKIDTGANVDYGARTDRSMKQFESSARQAGDLADRTRQGWADTQASKKENYGNREDYLKNAIHGAQMKEAEDLRYGREKAGEARGIARDKDKESDLMFREQRKDVISQGGQLAKREQALTQLTGELARTDLKSKDRERVLAKLGPIAAQAGVDIGSAVQAAETLQDEQPGFFGKLVGKKGKTAEELKKNLFDSLKGDIEALRAKQSAREERLRYSTTPMTLDEEEQISRLGAGAPVESGKGATPPPTPVSLPASGTTRIEYKGQLLDVPNEKLQDALKDGARLVK